MALICTVCDVDIGDCNCPGRDDKLKELAFSPTGVVLFKWCRGCDRHYARCRCETPDFYIVLKGQEVDISNGLQAFSGRTVRPNLRER